MRGMDGKMEKECRKDQPNTKKRPKSKHDNNNDEKNNNPLLATNNNNNNKSNNNNNNKSNNNNNNNNKINNTVTRSSNNNICNKFNTTPHNNIWLHEPFIRTFFHYIGASEVLVAARVCQLWRSLSYEGVDLWSGKKMRVSCKELSKQNGGSKQSFYSSLERRRIDFVCFENITDTDVPEVLQLFPFLHLGVHSLAVQNSTMSDKGLKQLTEGASAVTRLELVSCNDITEVGLWSCLASRMHHLCVSDCINVADDTVAAIGQLLPNLTHLNLQAYHVTDSSLSLFSAKQSHHLTSLRLLSCWEISNHGVVNVIRSLPNLTTLSLSGCSKISDDGVEVIAENLKSLEVLDLSWCPKVTDSSLEFIACDLCNLREITLDRCGHVTDIGVSYLSTIPSLTHLYLRWCCQVRETGLRHFCEHNRLKVLSIAGCTLITAHGLLGMGQMSNLKELELTNCFSSPSKETKAAIKALRTKIPGCLVIE